MDAIDKDKFGKFLTQMRREKGFTQQELADKLFVSNKAVSKWETGKSLPDIGLLVPLGELLEISVAELLAGERMLEQDIPTCEVKELVEKTVQLSAEEREQRRKNRCFWKKTWVVCVAVALLESMVVMNQHWLTVGDIWNMLFLVESLSLGFGVYFCFFVRETLPTYYDENRISVYSDGIFRMNLPGVSFHNSNWPYIIRAGRRCLLGTSVIWPPVCVFACRILCFPWTLILTLFFSLSFLLAMTVAAKKYQ